MASNSVDLSKPAISVVVPTYNRPSLLHAAVMSATSASSRHAPVVEVIVVNDHPIRPIELNLPAFDNARVRVVDSPVPSSGGGAAKAFGVTLATAPYLTFLDDDDEFCPEGVYRIVSALDSSELDLLYLATKVCLKDRPSEVDPSELVTADILRKHGFADAQGITALRQDVYTSLLRKVPMDFQRFAMRREAFARIGTFGPRSPIYDNYFSIRAAMSLRTGFLHGPVTYMYQGDQNIYTKPGKFLNQQTHHVRQLREILRTLENSHDLDRERIVRAALADVEFDSAYERLRSRQEIGQAIRLLLAAQSRQHRFSRWKALLAPLRTRAD